MDDFNMPTKDTYGSQPPLELIRLWLDYGFWYDRVRQTVRYIRVSFDFTCPTASAVSKCKYLLHYSREKYAYAEYLMYFRNLSLLLG